MNITLGRRGSLPSTARPCVFQPQPIKVQPARGSLIVQNAHKKGAGSTKNGRDSNSKSRGVKVYGGQPVKAGGIIVRQLGNKWHAGRNVGTGKDFTLFSLQQGIVVFETIKQRRCVSVYGLDHKRAQGWQQPRTSDGRAAMRAQAFREARAEKWKAKQQSS